MATLGVGLGEVRFLVDGAYTGNGLGGQGFTSTFTSLPVYQFTIFNILLVRIYYVRVLAQYIDSTRIIILWLYALLKYELHMNCVQVNRIYVSQHTVPCHTRYSRSCVTEGFRLRCVRLNAQRLNVDVILLVQN